MCKAVDRRRLPGAEATVCSRAALVPGGLVTGEPEVGLRYEADAHHDAAISI
jgi:hypothetical protein